MKIFGLILGVLALLGASQIQTPVEETIIVIGGDVMGNMAPCGCTKPMSGGIKRRASMIRMLTQGKKHLVLENGGMIADLGRQSELKAEALSEIFGSLDAIVHFHSGDVTLGRGALASSTRLVGKGSLGGGIEQDTETGLRSTTVKGDFVIGAASPRRALADALGVPYQDVQAVVNEVLNFADSLGKVPILLLDGDRQLAEEVATKNPKLRLIVYSSLGDPDSSLQRLGNTLLITPGEKGKHAIKLVYNGDFTGYAPINLGPEVPDDPVATKVYDEYLDRVRTEDLLGKLPRAKSEAFAGSRNCAPCHGVTYKKWEESRHANALTTLEHDNHDADPDCVGCHVVGLEAMGGFVSRAKTPQLASVGCESCHGPARAHAKDPWKKKLPKVGKDACLKCHTAHTSPNFDFDSYWQKIVHK